MYAITDRLQWAVPVPAFAYRFGEPSHLEIVPRLGLTAIGYSSFAGVLGTIDAGVAMRVWTSSRQSLLSSVSGSSGFTGRAKSSGSEGQASGPPTVWDVQMTAGYLWTLGETVSLHLAAGLEGPLGDVSPRNRGATLLLGSVQSIGYRSLPLIAVHVSPRFSLDAYASWAIDLRARDFRDRYLAGFTWSF